MKPGRADAPSPKKEYPSLFQRKTLWAAITGAAMLGIGAMSVYTVGVIARVLQFLQPVLVPIAFAGILAYLLEPLVKVMTRRGVPRFRAMMWVWVGFHLFLLMLIAAVAVPTISKGGRLIVTNSDRWVESVGGVVTKTLEAVDTMAERFLNRKKTVKMPIEPAPSTTPKTEPETETQAEQDRAFFEGETQEIVVPDPPSPEVEPKESAKYVQKWLAEHSEEISRRAVAWLGSGFQGIFGLVGYLVGFILVPIYLYYFLKESDGIKRNWSNYIPLRSSRFKAEVVETLSEINSYLVAFFRGQMLVSVIDGLLVGIALAVIGLPYSLLIGLFVALLGLIPYVGNFLCWLAAVMISLAHFGRMEVINGQTVAINTFAGIDNLWAYPLLVTGIFVVVQQINSLVTAPRIVGDAVGLHPLTVIFSVLFWSLLIGGLLGALLAVPLTAAVKVLFRRYIWERKVQPRIAENPPVDPAQSYG